MNTAVPVSEVRPPSSDENRGKKKCNFFLVRRNMVILLVHANASKYIKAKTNFNILYPIVYVKDYFNFFLMAKFISKTDCLN